MLLLEKVEISFSPGLNVFTGETGAGKSIIIDGLADDKAWDEANQIDDFFQHFPTDSLKAELKTSIKILRDESNIYLLARSETLLSS